MYDATFMQRRIQQIKQTLFQMVNHCNTLQPNDNGY